eukprot:CAMPEP_0170563032 /NCGR_PEP_ID=MMETSP0211-20121228/63791_1 /TAXON_ID=311385 /ORGANISM="Pseudokeronopsis sp., Strain OXSARD2" /LENGTH=41 /DNA_ID= /DNA_START= /DNA_END= /DNA_ORIENTATION=
MVNSITVPAEMALSKTSSTNILVESSARVGELAHSERQVKV